MKIDDKSLDKVSGGKIVETKEGKYILLPPNAKEFDTEEEAKKAEEKIKVGFGKFPHPHGPHCHHKMPKPFGPFIPDNEISSCDPDECKPE